MTQEPDLTPERVRELLDYDADTGVFTWRERPLRPGFERIDKGWNARFVGKTAGDQISQVIFTSALPIESNTKLEILLHTDWPGRITMVRGQHQALTIKIETRQITELLI